MSGTNILINVLLCLNVIVCTLMTLIILMQRSKQEGLGASFGSSVTDSVFGAQTSQVLVKTTVWLASIFFLLTIALAHLYAHRGSQSEIEQRLRAPGFAPMSSGKGSAPAAGLPKHNPDDLPVFLPATTPKTEHPAPAK
jgi:preprotein translocase subunit SecG